MIISIIVIAVLALIAVNYLNKETIRHGVYMTAALRAYQDFLKTWGESKDEDAIITALVEANLESGICWFLSNKFCKNCGILYHTSYWLHGNAKTPFSFWCSVPVEDLQLGILSPYWKELCQYRVAILQAELRAICVFGFLARFIPIKKPMAPAS